MDIVYNLNASIIFPQQDTFFYLSLFITIYIKHFPHLGFICLFIFSFCSFTF